jgi:hypothetical protein
MQEQWIVEPERGFQVLSSGEGGGDPTATPRAFGDWNARVASIEGA